MESLYFRSIDCDCFLTTYHFLPKKLKGWKRYVVAIVITVPIMLLMPTIWSTNIGFYFESENTATPKK